MKNEEKPQPEMNKPEIDYEGRPKPFVGLKFYWFPRECWCTVDYLEVIDGGHMWVQAQQSDTKDSVADIDLIKSKHIALPGEPNCPPDPQQSDDWQVGDEFWQNDMLCGWGKWRVVDTSRLPDSLVAVSSDDPENRAGFSQRGDDIPVLRIPRKEKEIDGEWTEPPNSYWTTGKIEFKEGDKISIDGQETVQNTTGATLTHGTPVYVSDDTVDPILVCTGLPGVHTTEGGGVKIEGLSPPQPAKECMSIGDICKPNEKLSEMAAPPLTKEMLQEAIETIKNADVDKIAKEQIKRENQKIKEALDKATENYAEELLMPKCPKCKERYDAVLWKACPHCKESSSLLYHSHHCPKCHRESCMCERETKKKVGERFGWGEVIDRVFGLFKDSSKIGPEKDKVGDKLMLKLREHMKEVDDYFQMRREKK